MSRESGAPSLVREFGCCNWERTLSGNTRFSVERPVQKRSVDRVLRHRSNAQPFLPTQGPPTFVACQLPGQPRLGVVRQIQHHAEEHGRGLQRRCPQTITPAKIEHSPLQLRGVWLPSHGSPGKKIYLAGVVSDTSTTAANCKPSLTAVSPSPGSTPPQKPSTNSTAASGAASPTAYRNVKNRTRDCSVAPWATSTPCTSRNTSSSAETATSSEPSGNTCVNVNKMPIPLSKPSCKPVN